MSFELKKSFELFGSYWFPGCAWEPRSRGSASTEAAFEAEPLDLHYQAEPGNE